jgi:hypothetical protein
MIYNTADVFEFLPLDIVEAQELPFWFDQQRHNKIYKNTKIDA